MHAFSKCGASAVIAPSLPRTFPTCVPSISSRFLLLSSLRTLPAHRSRIQTRSRQVRSIRDRIRARTDAGRFVQYATAFERALTRVVLLDLARNGQGFDRPLQGALTSRPAERNTRPLTAHRAARLLRRSVRGAQGLMRADAPARLLGTVENSLGIKKRLEDAGHTVVVTDDKEGPDSTMQKEIGESRVVRLD